MLNYNIYPEGRQMFLVKTSKANQQYVHIQIVSFLNLVLEERNTIEFWEQVILQEQMVMQILRNSLSKIWAGKEKFGERIPKKLDKYLT